MLVLTALLALALSRQSPAASASPAPPLAALLLIAQEAGTPIDRLRWDCADAGASVLGAFDGSLLCLPGALPKTLEAQTVVAAMALARIHAGRAPRGAPKTTLGSLLAGMVAADIESTVQSDYASNPNPLKSPDAFPPLPSPPPPPDADMAWQSRGLAWAERAGVAPARAMAFLRASSGDARLNPAQRREFRSILRALGPVG